MPLHVAKSYGLESATKMGVTPYAHDLERFTHTTFQLHPKTSEHKLNRLQKA